MRFFCASLCTLLGYVGLTVHYYNTIWLLPVGRPAVGERVSACACVCTYEILYVCLEREPNRVRSYTWRRCRLSMLNSRLRIFSLGRVAAWQWSRRLFVYRGKTLLKKKTRARSVRRCAPSIVHVHTLTLGYLVRNNVRASIRVFEFDRCRFYFVCVIISYTITQ